MYIDKKQQLFEICCHLNLHVHGIVQTFVQT